MRKQSANFLVCCLAVILCSDCTSTVLRMTSSRNFLYCSAVSDTVLITGGGGGIDAWNLANRTAPRLMSSVFTGSAVAGVALRWPVVYAASGRAGLVIASFKDPLRPKVERVCDLQMNTVAVDVIDSFAVVIGIDNFRGCLKVVALGRTPPQVTDSFTITGSMSSLHCEDSTVFVCGTESWSGFLRTYTLERTSGKIKSMAGMALDASAWCVTSRDRRAVIAQGEKGVFIVDAEAPDRLVQVASTPCGKFAKEAFIGDSLVFVLNDKQGVTVLDLAGNLHRTLSIKGITHFSVQFPYIYALCANKSISVLTFR